MPAMAQTSSASPPGAPETPIDPTIEPAASIGRPPPMATTPGRSRMPEADSPDWVARAKARVSSLKLSAVQALPVAVEGV